MEVRCRCGEHQQVVVVVVQRCKIAVAMSIAMVVTKQPMG